MYDELVKRLRNCAEGFKCRQCEYELVNGCRTKLNNEAADAIELLQKTQQPRWIPVSERLPKAERKSYWVCTDTGYQCECRWTNNLFGMGESDEWVWSIFDIPQYQKVVAWMPLPDPYEPPKEEEDGSD